MAISRAQYITGDSGQGVVFSGQVQGVKQGKGVLIEPDGVISVDASTAEGLVRLNNPAAFNGYVWPTTSGTDDQVLAITPGSVLIWRDTSTIGFGIGTKMLFYQAAAPINWATDTSLSDLAVRIVASGGGVTGGSTNFSSSFTSYTPNGSVSSSGNCVPQGSVTLNGLSVSGLSVNGSVGGTSLSESQIANHGHSFSPGEVNAPTGQFSATRGNQALGRSGTSIGRTGGGGSHSHSFSGSASGGNVSGSASFSGSNTSVNVSSSFTGQPTNQFAVKYINTIVASKIA